MFEVPSIFRPSSIFGPPPMFSGISQSSPSGVESTWCLSFDGSNDHINTGMTGGSYERTDSFSFSVWVYHTVSATRYIMSKATSAERGIEFLLRGGIYPEFNLISTWPTSGLMVQSTQAITLNQWHHIAVTYSGTSLASGVKIFIDGVEVSGYYITINNLTTTTTNSEPIVIGMFRGTHYSLSGRLDDFRAYSRAISSTEVTAIYTNTSPPTTGLTFHLPMEEGAGTTTVDAVGGVTATLTNGPTWSSSVPPALA